MQVEPKTADCRLGNRRVSRDPDLSADMASSETPQEDRNWLDTSQSNPVTEVTSCPSRDR